MNVAHVLLMSLAAGEGQPHLVERVLDERFETQRRACDLAPSLRVTFHDGEIVATVARERRCIAERVRVRQIGLFSPRPWALPAGIGLAVGGGGLLVLAGGLAVVAPNQPSINDPFSRGELSREAAGTLAAVTGLLGAAGAVGGVAVAMLVGDELISKRVDDDVIDSTRVDCAPVPMSGINVRLMPQGARTSDGITDEEGRVSWPAPVTPTIPAEGPWARAVADIETSDGQPMSIAVELPPSAYMPTLAASDLDTFNRFATRFPRFELPGALEFRRQDLDRAARVAQERAAREKEERDAETATRAAAEEAETARQHAAAAVRAAADLERRTKAATSAWSRVKWKTPAAIEAIVDAYGEDALTADLAKEREKLEAKKQARVTRLVESSHAKAARGDLKGAMAAIKEAAELDPEVDVTPRAVLLGGLAQPPERILPLFQQDVFAYFELEGRFSTELEQRAFKKTDEYREKKAELAALLAKASRKRHSVTPDLKLGAYSVKDGAFLVETGHANLANGLAWVQAPRTFNKVLYFPKLPVRMGGLPAHLVEPGGPEWESLILRVPEEKALEIERARGATRIVLIFTPKVATRTPPFRVFSIDRWYEMTPQVVRCDLHAIAIVDENSGAVFHVQTF